MALKAVFTFRINSWKKKYKCATKTWRIHYVQQKSGQLKKAKVNYSWWLCSCVEDWWTKTWNKSGGLGLVCTGPLSMSYLNKQLLIQWSFCVERDIQKHKHCLTNLGRFWPKCSFIWGVFDLLLSLIVLQPPKQWYQVLPFHLMHVLL